MIKLFFIVITTTLVLSSCSLTPSSTFVNFRVSRVSDPKTDCASGLQAKLTFLSDQAVIESPKLLEVNDLFLEDNGLKYPVKTRVRVEANCFESDGTKGLLIVEGMIQTPFKNNYRSVSVYLPSLITSGCITAQNTEDRDITVIDYQEPAPCISPDEFTFPL